MSGFDRIRKVTEQICTEEGIPEELQATFETLWKEIHTALIKAENDVDRWAEQ